MPFAMAGHIQSVMVQGTVYVGGGFVGIGSDNNFIVMAYETHSRKWHQLPPYRARDFAMVVINNQLVLVGGHDHKDAATNLLGVWEAESGYWTHPYPPMPTPRGLPCAIAYKQCLLGADGVPHGSGVTTLEMLDVDNRRWLSTLFTPAPLRDICSSIVGDMWSHMGDYGDCHTDRVYTVTLPAFVFRSTSVISLSTLPQMRSARSGLRDKYCTLLSIGGSLLAVGGVIVKDRKVVSPVHRYVPESGEWVVVGELPSPLHNFTCAVISAGELLVCGGCSLNSDRLSRVYVGNFM